MRLSMLLLVLLVFMVGVLFCQETYQVGRTEYYYSQFYVITGKPQVKRSYSNRRDFLRERGLEEVPEGYEIDHIIPLFEGGTDDPGNMQLCTIEEHAKKTREDRRIAIIKYSYFKYPSNEQYFKSYNINNTNLYPGDTNAAYSGLDYLGRAIFMTASWKYFYFNRQGKKNC